MTILIKPSLLNTLIDATANFLDSEVTYLNPLDGGYEAMVLRASTAEEEIVIHVSPKWKDPNLLAWTHRIAQKAYSNALPAVAPLVRGGRSYFIWQNQPVAIFPFIHGESLNPDSEKARNDAAGILGGIHHSLSDWREPPPETNKLDDKIPPDLTDPTLDRNWRQLLKDGLFCSATHGDYYAANILTRNEQVVGVIDWNEAEIRPVLLDLAGATFELCKDKYHHLNLVRVRSFIDAYLTGGGTVSPAELKHLGVAIRIWIRSDILPSLNNPNYESLDEAHKDYVALQISAFKDLGRQAASAELDALFN